MAFPSLFPTGKGDPFASVSTQKRHFLLEKAKNLMFYAESINNELECRFASHPRFVLWINNIILRHQTISRGNFFLKKDDAISKMTARDVQNCIKNGNTEHIINNLRRDSNTIRGSQSYWYQTNQDLKSIIDSKGPPHIFFTHSFADLYDPYLHKFLNIPKETSNEMMRKKLINIHIWLIGFLLRNLKNLLKNTILSILMPFLKTMDGYGIGLNGKTGELFMSMD